jgi:hypothetical protein
MGLYADAPHQLERVQLLTDQGQRVYYRSNAFWRASAAVNLPSAIGNTNYSGINGFDSRCCAYGVIMAVVTDTRFPSGQRDVIMYPEGYVARRP